MEQLELILPSVTASRVAQALNRGIVYSEEDYNLGRWQPDWVIISETHKRIAIADLCRPADVHPSQLLVAGDRKQQKYSVLVEALGFYIDQGWLVQVFPWVVGIRGLIDPRLINALLQFLNIPKKHWRGAVEKSVLASVRAFYSLHQIRFGGSQRVGWYDSGSSINDDEEMTSDTLPSTHKRGLEPAHESGDLEVLHGTDSPLGHQKKSRVNSALDSRHRSRGPCCATTRPHKGRDTRRHSVKHSPDSDRTVGQGAASASAVRVESGIQVEGIGNGTNSQGSPRMVKRKRQSSASTTFVYDTDDPDRRVPMQPLQVDDDHPDALWSRWRWMEGRKRRSSCSDHASSATPSG